MLLHTQSCLTILSLNSNKRVKVRAVPYIIALFLKTRSRQKDQKIVNQILLYLMITISISTWLRNRTFIINESTTPSVAQKTFFIINLNAIAIIRECFCECNESDNPDVLREGEQTPDASGATLRYYITLWYLMYYFIIFTALLTFCYLTVYLKNLKKK